MSGEAAMILELRDAEKIEVLGGAIKKAHEEYQFLKSIQGSMRSSKELKKEIGKLHGRLFKVLESIYSIEPLYFGALGASAQRAAPHRSFDVDSVIPDLQQLTMGVSHFLDLFDPPKGNPGNLPLEAAVRVLLPVVEDLTSSKALVSLNKHSGDSPQPRSKAARAIVATIRKFEEPPSDSAILNMITKVQLRSEPTLDTIDAILEAQGKPLPAGNLDD